MPSRALLCLTLSPAAPSLTRGEMPTLVSPFGRWLHGQVIATSRQWPAVAFHRLRFIGSEVRLVLFLRHSAPPLVAGLAVAHALEREVARAARSVGWLDADQELWLAGGTLVWCAIDVRVVGFWDAGCDSARRVPALGCGASGALRLLAQRRDSPGLIH
jgi:hypothetical protein